MFGRKRLACSFCGKSAAEVTKLVAGPGVYICDECVAAASRIMKGDEPHPPTSHPDRRGRLATLWARLHRLFDHGRVHRSLYQSVALASRSDTAPRSMT